VGNNNIDGNTLERQSKQSASLLLTYEDKIGSDFNLYTNVDFNYQSKQYLEALNLGNTGDRFLTNAKIGVANDHWDVSLWSKNLFDEKYISNSFVIFFANSYVAALGEGRQYGLTVKYKL
jgi:iron complex outermembrane receptor protein